MATNVASCMPPRTRSEFTAYGAKSCEVSCYVPLSATVASPAERAWHLAALLGRLALLLEVEFGAPVTSELISVLFSVLDAKDAGAAERIADAAEDAAVRLIPPGAVVSSGSGSPA